MLITLVIVGVLVGALLWIVFRNRGTEPATEPATGFLPTGVGGWIAAGFVGVLALWVAITAATAITS